MAEKYTHNQLLILHHLKRYGPLNRTTSEGNITETMAVELGMKHSTLKYLLRNFEKDCIILRTYSGGIKAARFGAGANQPMVKLELVDPNMPLPPIPQVYTPHPPPKPLPLGVVLAHETEELEHRQNGTAPTVESVIEALIDRALELQHQVDKLHGVITQLTSENDLLKKRLKPPPNPHLTERIRGVLTEEQWTNLRKS